jgi:Creatinine amidohydrolase
VRLRYEEHTWPELRELAAREDLVVVIPTATLEDHGHHLPIDTDARLISAICERAVQDSDGRALLFPTRVHGYTPRPGWQGSARSKTAPSARGSPPIGWGSGGPGASRAAASARSKPASSSGSPPPVV